LALEDDELALRRNIWLATDVAFKRAARSLSRKRSVLAARGTKPRAADWSAAPRGSLPSRPMSAGPDEPVVLAKLAEIARALSAELRGFPSLLESNVVLIQHNVRQRIATSERRWKDERRSQLELAIYASTQASDGMPLTQQLFFDAAGPDGLPELGRLKDATRALATRVVGTREAAAAPSGLATVVFTERAAGQVMRHLLAKELDGVAPPLDADAGSQRPEAAAFAERIGQKIGPDFLSVFDDPAARVPTGAVHFGAYAADDEAVPAAKINLIERGVLTGLYMSRTPGRRFDVSNGHGRGRATAGAVRGAPGVLFVTAGKLGRDPSALAAQAQKVDRTRPVYVVRSLTTTGGLRATSIEQLDQGGQSKPVRGVTFPRLSAGALADIVALGREPIVYNFLAQRTPAEGGVGTTIVTPSVVIKDVEVRSDEKPAARPPLYPHPSFLPAAQR
jgi:hypothetical protein